MGTASEAWTKRRRCMRVELGVRRRWRARPGRLAPQAALDQFEHALREQCQHRRRQRAGEQRGVVVERQPGGDAFAVAAGADEGGDGRGADRDHGRRLDAGHHHRHRQRQVDQPPALPRLQPQRCAPHRAVPRAPAASRWSRCARSAAAHTTISATSAGSVPMRPSSGISIANSASDGTVCSTPTTAITGCSTRGHAAAAVPSGTPISTAGQHRHHHQHQVLARQAPEVVGRTGAATSRCAPCRAPAADGCTKSRAMSAKARLRNSASPFIAIMRAASMRPSSPWIAAPGRRTPSSAHRADTAAPRRSAGSTAGRRRAPASLSVGDLGVGGVDVGDRDAPRGQRLVRDAVVDAAWASAAGRSCAARPGQPSARPRNSCDTATTSSGCRARSPMVLMSQLRRLRGRHRQRVGVLEAQRHRDAEAHRREGAPHRRQVGRLGVLEDLGIDGAGVLGVDVDRAGLQRLEHDRGVAQALAVLGLARAARRSARSPRRGCTTR